MERIATPSVNVRTIVVATCSTLSLLLLPTLGYSQAEWIHRMDDDRNGYIEPDEISDRGRRFLEEAVVPYGISLSRPNSVKKIEQAARLHFQRRNSPAPAAKTPKADQPTMKGFGIEEDQPLVPAFGSGDLKYPYTKADLEEAERVMRSTDKNDDNILDPREIQEGRWDGRDPYECDVNGDRRLTLIELTQRYARRRIAAGRSMLSLGTTGDTGSTANDERRDWRELQGAGASRSGDRGSDSLARSIVERYDFNRNDQLEPQEMAAVGIAVAKVDYDRSGTINSEELSKYLFDTMESKANTREEAIPTWFFERDANGDQQVLMAEFTDEWDEQKLEQFASYDNNQDGIITIDEVLSLNTVSGGSYASTEAEVLLPRTTIVSEIEVGDDYLIGDLNVQLSITHTYVEQLDGYLLSPDGQRVELFTGVGGSDDHFNKTIFDDDAGERITRARPPFEGSYRPEALDRRQPGLNQFRGKNLKGTWQLMIRAARSERSGVLHGWSLNVQPDRSAVDDPESAKQRLEAAEKEKAAQEKEASKEDAADNKASEPEPQREEEPRRGPRSWSDFRRGRGPR